MVFFVHMLQHLVDAEGAVCLGIDHGDVIAHGGQALQRLLHAGVLEPGHHDALAEFAGERRAQQGQIVALATAGGEIELFGLAAKGAGHRRPGRVEGLLAPGPGAYRDEGFAQCSRMALSMTSATSGATMVVAALSR